MRLPVFLLRAPLHRLYVFANKRIALPQAVCHLRALALTPNFLTFFPLFTRLRTLPWSLPICTAHSTLRPHLSADSRGPFLSLTLHYSGQVVRDAEVECHRLELDLAPHDFRPLVARSIHPSDQIEVVHALQRAKICTLCVTSQLKEDRISGQGLPIWLI